jgi:hypothetical protein
MIETPQEFVEHIRQQGLLRIDSFSTIAFMDAVEEPLKPKKFVEVTFRVPAGQWRTSSSQNNTYPDAWGRDSWQYMIKKIVNLQESEKKFRDVFKETNVTSCKVVEE